VVNADEIIRRLQGPDPRTLPRLATLVENEDPRGLAALDLIYPLTGTAHVVGITGPPGAGKSTLVAALLEKIRQSERRVAVLAVDPSSTLTGGAVLGDRIRMMDTHADNGVFVRSMASRGRQGGLAWSTAGLVHLLDAAGFPIILVETVGTGQDGTDIASLADSVVVVEAPGLGDGVQAIKSGLLEVGDVVVVNKADQPGADDALRILRASFELSHDALARRIPVLGTVATTGHGADKLIAAIDSHGAWLTETGQRELRRERGARAEVLAGLRATLDRRLDAGRARSPQLSEVIARVARRDMSPRQAIDTLSAGIDALTLS
jgi:LAO/AO transport system kinase